MPAARGPLRLPQVLQSASNVRIDCARPQRAEHFENVGGHIFGRRIDHRAEIQNGIRYRSSRVLSQSKAAQAPFFERIAGARRARARPPRRPSPDRRPRAAPARRSSCRRCRDRRRYRTQTPTRCRAFPGTSSANRPGHRRESFRQQPSQRPVAWPRCPAANRPAPTPAPPKPCPRPATCTRGTANPARRR